MQQIDLQQLQYLLVNVIEQVSNWRPTSAALFQLLYKTGLRANEAISTGGWQRTPSGDYAVQLSKREGVRTIAQNLVPDILQPYYDKHKPFLVETYSSLNNTFKNYCPQLYFENDRKSTALHAYRYAFMQQLRADGMSLKDIADIMGHLGQSATAGYVTARIYRRG